jgi:hypothetical protein
MTAFTERLVHRLATARPGRRTATRGPSRRGFLAATTLGGAALAVNPFGFVFKPMDAYAATCGTDPNCADGYSAFCCTIHGTNTCPPNTFVGGWWKADRSSFCGGAARYYLDCNALPGYTFHCHCADNGTCDHRRVACNIFRYGQCNTQIHGTTAVVCRQISCRPPWEIYPGKCGTSSATDQNTAGHTAPCLAPVWFPEAPTKLYGGHSLGPGHRLTSWDRHTSAVMQTDGNFVVRNQDGVVWSTNTPHAAGGKIVMWPGGNLQLYDRNGRSVWQTHTVGRGTDCRLYLSSSGDLMVNDHNGRRIWHTNTHTP